MTNKERTSSQGVKAVVLWTVILVYAGDPLPCVSRQELQQMQEGCTLYIRAGKEQLTEDSQEAPSKRSGEVQQRGRGSPVTSVCPSRLPGFSEGKLGWRLLGGCRVREEEPQKESKVQSSQNPLSKLVPLCFGFLVASKVHKDLVFSLWRSWVAVRPLESGALWDVVKSPEAHLWEEKGDLSLFLSFGFLAAMEPVALSTMCSCNHDLTIVPEVTEPPGYGNLRNRELNKYPPLSLLSQTRCDSRGKLTNSHCEQGQAHRRLTDTQPMGKWSRGLQLRLLCSVVSLESHRRVALFSSTTCLPTTF